MSEVSMTIRALMCFSAYVGSCVSKGYTGCCESGDCLGADTVQQSCYCDALCHRLGDCCDDIADVSCPAPGIYVPFGNHTHTSAALELILRYAVKTCQFA